MCRSDPHTPAAVSFTRMAPGSTSGTGYSRRSNSPPYARSTATRPFISMLLLSWPACLEHEGVQRNADGTVAERGGHRGRGGKLDFVESGGPTLHDGAQDRIAFDEAAGCLGCRRTRSLLCQMRQLDLPEARLREHLSNRLRIVKAERHQVECGRIRREELAHRLVGDARERVPIHRVPHIEKILPAWLEDAKRLADACGLVGEEHEPELADHSVEGAIGERQAGGVGGLPLDVPGAGQHLGTPMLDHRLVEVRRDDRSPAAEPVGEAPRDDARAACRLEKP